MQDIHPRCLEFIGSKVQELIRNGISVYLSNGLDINNKYSGSFNGYYKTLKVAMGMGEVSVYTFIHEYAHFLQFRDKYDVWFKLHEEGTNQYSLWLNGDIELNEKEIDFAFRSVLTLEHDAESIANAIISVHQLPLDLPRLSRVANSNLLFYSWTRIKREWGNGCFPVDDGIIEQYLPSVLQPLDYFLDKRNAKSIFKKAGIK